MSVADATSIDVCKRSIYDGHTVLLRQRPTDGVVKNTLSMASATPVDGGSWDRCQRAVCLLFLPGVNGHLCDLPCQHLLVTNVPRVSAYGRRTSKCGLGHLDVLLL